MLVIHVHVHVQPGRVDDFLAATLANARASLTEPGVLRFDIIQDQADPAHVILVEVYRDADASAAHKKTPHYAAWRDRVAEMLAEPRESTKFAAVFPADTAAWATEAGAATQSGDTTAANGQTPRRP
jgi:autoinducer 2-degrading protein